MIVEVELTGGDNVKIEDAFKLVIRLAEELGLSVFDLRVRPTCRRL